MTSPEERVHEYEAESGAAYADVAAIIDGGVSRLEEIIKRQAARRKAEMDVSAGKIVSTRVFPYASVGGGKKEEFPGNEF